MTAIRVLTVNNFIGLVGVCVNYYKSRNIFTNDIVALGIQNLERVVTKAIPRI